MRRILAAALALSPLASSGCATVPASVEQVSPQAVVDDLIAADRAYAASGSALGLIDAIAAMMDEQAVMPTPSAAFAKGREQIVTALRSNPANAQARAEWFPVRGGVSADGMHGFTYGFMTIREPGKADRRAKYLSYWVKRPDGWKVALYKRAGSAPGEVQTAMRPPALPAAMVAQAGDGAEQRASLIAAEKAFSDRAQQVGLKQAFAEFGSADAMNLGSGPDFTFGADAIAGGMPPDPKSPVHWAADEGALVAASGDLGVTWGFIRSHSPQPGQPAAIPFFTVWRKADAAAPWRYVAE